MSERSASRLFTGFGIGGTLVATNAIVAERSNARRHSLSVAVMAGMLFSHGWELPPGALVLCCGTLCGGIALSRVRYRETEVA